MTEAQKRAKADELITWFVDRGIEPPEGGTILAIVVAELIAQVDSLAMLEEGVAAFQDTMGTYAFEAFLRHRSKVMG